MDPFTTLVVAGISWIATTSRGGIVEGLADRAFVAVVRTIREQLPAFAGRPEGRDLARGVRQAQLHALQRLIQDYRTQRPFARLGKGSDPFSERALEFCQSATAQPVLRPSVSGDALLALAPASTDLDGLAAGAAAMEEAVLAELAVALDGIPVPDAFVDYFRNGGRGTPRFVELFGIYFTEQVKKDDAFRKVLHTRLLLQNAANLTAQGDWLVQVEARFGGALARLETGVAELAAESRVGTEVILKSTEAGTEAILKATAAGTEAILKALAAGKGVPAAALWPILEKFGEPEVEDVDILERLNAKADEYLAFQEQLSTLAESTPNARTALSEGSQLLDTGDLDGARRLFIDARAALRATHARDEAALLGAEAGVDRLQVRYREAASRYQEAERLVAPFDPDARFDYLCRRASTLQEHGYQFSDSAALAEAVSLWRHAVQLRPRSESPVEWAKTLNSLGIALRVLGKHEVSTARLQEAVAAHRAALEELRRERMPLDWASTQDSLGSALLLLGWFESDSARLGEALVVYRASLEEHTRERVPHHWARTQGNLAGALLGIGTVEGATARLEEAVAIYRESLAVRPREPGPFNRAIAQHNLGIALWNLGQRETGTARLEEAVAVLRAALEEQDRERVPAYWAGTQQYLGLALRSLGDREGDTSRLEEAVAAYRAALEERTRERAPLQWAGLQRGLGNALQVLGEREGDAAALEEAVAAYYAALEEKTREPEPLVWAMIHHELGNALRTLGARERGTARLEEAVAAYHAALEEQTREQVPAEWALTQLDLGSALLMLGERENGTAWLKEAIICFRSSSEVFKAVSASFEITVARAHLARAHLLREFRMIADYDSWCRPP